MGMIGEVREIARDAWGFFKPPRTGNAAEDAWRMKIVASLAMLFGLVGAHAYLTDTMPWGGAVAKAADQRELGSKLDTLLAQNTKQYKISLGQEICRLYRLRNMAPPNSALWSQLDRNYEEKQGEYSDLNERVRYPVAECMPE